MEKRYQAALSDMIPLLELGKMPHLDGLVEKLSEKPDFGERYGGDEVRACFWSMVDAGKARYSNSNIALVSPEPRGFEPPLV